MCVAFVDQRLFYNFEWKFLVDKNWTHLIEHMSKKYFEIISPFKNQFKKQVMSCAYQYFSEETKLFFFTQNKHFVY